MVVYFIIVIIIVASIGLNDRIKDYIKRKEFDRDFDRGRYDRQADPREQLTLCTRYYEIWERMVKGIGLGKGIDYSEAKAAGISFPKEYMTIAADKHAKAYCMALAQKEMMRRGLRPANVLDSKYNKYTYDPIAEHGVLMWQLYPDGIPHDERWKNEQDHKGKTDAQIRASGQFDPGKRVKELWSTPENIKRYGGSYNEYAPSRSSNGNGFISENPEAWHWMRINIYYWTESIFGCGCEEFFTVDEKAEWEKQKEHVVQTAKHFLAAQEHVTCIESKLGTVSLLSGADKIRKERNGDAEFFQWYQTYCDILDGKILSRDAHAEKNHEEYTRYQQYFNDYSLLYAANYYLRYRYRKNDLPNRREFTVYELPKEEIDRVLGLYQEYQEIMDGTWLEKHDTKGADENEQSAQG